MRGFQRMQKASATITGLEVMHVIRRSHCILRAPGAIAEIRPGNQLFGLAA
jgi:transposase, IS6 family